METKTYDFLGVINGVFIGHDDDYFSYSVYSTLVVYNNDASHTLKICVRELLPDDKAFFDQHIHLLDDFGDLEYSLITRDFDNIKIRELVFSKLYDYIGERCDKLRVY